MEEEKTEGKRDKLGRRKRRKKDKRVRKEDK